MSLTLERKKKFNIKLSIAYKLKRFVFLSEEKKLKLFLDLAWIFSRLAHEAAAAKKIKSINTFLLQNITENMVVLDLGCGQGYVIAQLLTKTNKIIGVDYDNNAIEIARNKFKDTTSIKLYATDIFHFFEHLNEEVDCVVLSHVLEHIDDRIKLLKFLNSKTKYLYVEVPDFESNYLNHYRNLVNTDLIYTDADHVIEFDRDDLQKTLENCGFTILSAEFKGNVIKYYCKSNRIS